MSKLIKVASAVTGLTFGMVVIAIPAASVGALADTSQSLTREKRLNQSILKLDESQNAAVSVTTELDCNTHTFTAYVTNKLGADISPQVTFNSLPPVYVFEPVIKPGETMQYQYAYSGNNIFINTKVQVDGHEDTKLSSRANCSEPVSFTVNASSTSAVTGYLQNNSTLLPQTVLLRVGYGDIRTEVLMPGESRLIALPFNGTFQQRYAHVTIAVTGGYESTYMVDLKQPILPL